MKRLLAAIGSLLGRLVGRRRARPALPSQLSSDRAEQERQVLEAYRRQLLERANYRRQLAEKAKRGTLS